MSVLRLNHTQHIKEYKIYGIYILVLFIDMIQSKGKKSCDSGLSN